MKTVVVFVLVTIAAAFIMIAAQFLAEMFANFARTM